MQIDCSVELGRDDPTIEIPWSSPDGVIRYRNLKVAPEALDEIPEATNYPELRGFLAQIIAPDSKLESAKCDVWSSAEIHPEEEIFGEPCKFASYVDLFFSEPQMRGSFPRNEQFLRDLTACLSSAPDLPASAEFVLRRCFDRRNDQAFEGFYFTAYVFGYGDDILRARSCWAKALAIVGDAVQSNQAQRT